MALKLNKLRDMGGFSEMLKMFKNIKILTTYTNYLLDHYNNLYNELL